MVKDHTVKVTIFFLDEDGYDVYAEIILITIPAFIIRRKFRRKWTVG